MGVKMKSFPIALACVLLSLVSVAKADTIPESGSWACSGSGDFALNPVWVKSGSSASYDAAWSFTGSESDALGSGSLNTSFAVSSTNDPIFKYSTDIINDG